jgi:hypothetical protein
VRLALHDGEGLTIAADDVPRVCENLWRLAGRQEAIFMYGVVMAESRRHSARLPLELTSTQTAVMREAVAMLDA